MSADAKMGGRPSATNFSRYPRQMGEINRVIEGEHPGVVLVKGDDFFYIEAAPRHPDIAARIRNMKKNRIDQKRISALTFRQWIDAITTLLAETNQK